MAHLCNVEPEDAPVVELSRAIALPARLPTSLRLQQYHARFEEYKDTWEFSAKLQGLLQEHVLQSKILIGALFLHPFLVGFPFTESTQPVLQFSPQLVWFRIRAQTKLKRLMLALATAVSLEPGRLYFYNRGSQVNPESTVAQLSILSGEKLEVEVEFDTGWDARYNGCTRADY